jgi:hypothetical protein
LTATDQPEIVVALESFIGSDGFTVIKLGERMRADDADVVRNRHLFASSRLADWELREARLALLDSMRAKQSASIE